MNIMKTMVASATFAFLAPTTFAQVFVIGTGLGGECYQQTQRNYTSYTTAERTCTRAIREETMTRPNRAATYVNRGVLRMRNGDYDSAIADYAEAVRLQPELGAAYLNQGAALIYKKEFGAAIGPLDKAIELNSSDLFAAYYNRGIAREHSGDVNGAYQDFLTALELKPDWDLAQYQLNRFSVETVGG